MSCVPVFDPEDGGTIAAHLDDLYRYVTRQLVIANLQHRPEILEEVTHVLNEIRSAWIALPVEARALPPGATSQNIALLEDV